MIRELSLKITPQFNGAPAKKGIQDQSKSLLEQKKIIGDVGKEQGKALKNTRRDMDDLRKESERTGVSLKGVFSGAKAEIGQFGDGLRALKDKFINLKTIVAGGLVGGVVIEGIKKTFEAGSALKAARGRIGREFGGESGQVQAAALRFGRGSGIGDEDALKAIIPIAEAIQETQAGANLRGKRLSAAGAAAARKQTLGLASDLLRRGTVVAGADPQELAMALAGAGQGPEGIRRLASTLGVSPVFARELSKANEQNKGVAFLASHGQKEMADRLRKQGVTGKLGQGSVIEAIYQQGGITEAGYNAKIRTMGFQKQAIGASVGNVLGDIGEKALDKLTAGLGKGKTLAEKFQMALESPKGKKVIEQISTGIEKMVEALVKVPAIIGKIAEHKTLLLSLAGGFGLFKGVQAAGSIIGGTKDLLGKFGIGGKAGGALGELLGAKPIPVYIVDGPGSSLAGAASKAAGAQGLLAKAGLVGVAGLAGYALGTYADKKLGLSDKIGKSLAAQDFGNIARERLGVETNAKQLQQLAATRNSRVAELEATGKTHGQALYLADHPESAQAQPTPVNVTLTLDGQVLAKVVSKHQARGTSVASAGGVAPGGRP